MVDRRFNRTRYDADRIIAAFAARLQDAIDLSVIGTHGRRVPRRWVESMAVLGDG
jgi:hypothetical protein